MNKEELVNIDTNDRGYVVQKPHTVNISTDDKEIKHLFKDVTSLKIEDKRLTVVHYFTKDRYAELKRLISIDKNVALDIKIEDLVITETYSLNDYSIEIVTSKLVTLTVYLGEIYLFKNRTVQTNIDYEALSDKQIKELNKPVANNEIIINEFGLLDEESLIGLANLLKR